LISQTGEKGSKNFERTDLKVDDAAFLQRALALARASNITVPQALEDRAVPHGRRAHADVTPALEVARQGRGLGLPLEGKKVVQGVGQNLDPESGVLSRV
jgi:hypothetical protein